MARKTGIKLLMDFVKTTVINAHQEFFSEINQFVHRCFARYNDHVVVCLVFFPELNTVAQDFSSGATILRKRCHLQVFPPPAL